MINENDYLSYLHSLRSSIFKILPLYEEEKVKTLPKYIESLIFEVHNVKKITPEYDGAWLVATHANLNGLVNECQIDNNKDIIKSKVFSMVKIISNKIEELEQDEKNVQSL